MNSIETPLGLIAAFLTTVSFLPQVLKIWRTKSAGDLSFVAFSTFCIGVVLWLVYGLIIHNVPIILSNLVTITLCGTIVGMMFHYRKGAARP